MATKTGGPNNDILNGTSAADTLYGRGGNDTLNGLASADKLYGETGNDTLRGGLGDDRLDGGSGVDTASYSDATGGVDVRLLFGQGWGNRGADTLVSVENLTGGAYNDVLYGNDGKNILRGSGGNDDVYGYGGNDTLYGGDGNDKLGGAAGDNVLYGGNHDDQLEGGSGVDQLYGEAGTDGLFGGNGNDRLYGGAGDDHLDDLGDGDDWLVGGLGVDYLVGRAGSDTFAFETIQDTGIGEQIADFVQGVDRVDVSLIDADVGLGGDQAFTFLGNDTNFTAPGQIGYLQSGDYTYVYLNVDRGSPPEGAFAMYATNLAASDFVL